ncbi:unnamed protein product, partial [Brassica napus]
GDSKKLVLSPVVGRRVSARGRRRRACLAGGRRRVSGPVVLAGGRLAVLRCVVVYGRGVAMWTVSLSSILSLPGGCSGFAVAAESTGCYGVKLE